MAIEAIFAIVVGIVYLAIVVFWITNYFSRIEPYLLQRIGLSLGLKIKRDWRNWRILDKQHTWQQGCLVAILELLVTVFFLIAPFWLLIGAILVMFLLSGRG